MTLQKSEENWVPLFCTPFLNCSLEQVLKNGGVAFKRAVFGDTGGPERQEIGNGNRNTNQSSIDPGYFVCGLGTGKDILAAL
jgi:hypothetical protein